MHLAQYLYHTADLYRKGNSTPCFLSEEMFTLNSTSFVLRGPKLS